METFGARRIERDGEFFAGLPAKERSSREVAIETAGIKAA
jgi:hypothetical protein